MDSNIKAPNNSEIDQALKEFEMKNKIEQTQKIQQEILKTSNVPKMVKLMMKWSGLERKQAEYILFSFAVVAIMVSFVLFFWGGSRPQMLTPAMIEQIKQSMSKSNSF